MRTKAFAFPSTFLAIAGLACCLALALAAPAMAQTDPICSQYEETTGKIESNVTDERCDPDTAIFSGGGAGDPGGLSGEVGSLPFTGFDLIAAGIVSLVLLGTGFVLRRLSGPRDA